MAKRKTEAFPYRQRTILLLDLSREGHQVLPLSEEQAKRLLGGRSLSLGLWEMYVDWNRLKKDDYEEGNPIVIAIGSGSDTDVPFLDGFAVTTKSPVTGRVETYAGEGAFTKVFGALGVSAIVIVGRRSRITHVAVEDQDVRYLTEEELHNLPVSMLCARYPSMHTVSIGPAGEQQVPASCIAVDGKLFGRAGFGVVFARKNIKVITFSVHEKERSSYATEEVGSLADWYGKFVKKCKVKSLIRYGQENGWIALHGFSDVTDGRLWALEKEKEITPVLALGANLGLFNPKRIATLSDCCTQMGLDPCSASIIILYALRQHLVQEKEAYRVLEGISLRRGAFMDLADGAPKDFYTIGNLEMAPFEIRSIPSMALLESMDDDTVVWEDLVRKNHMMRGGELRFARRAIDAQDLRFVMESLGLPYRLALPLASCPFSFAVNPYLSLSRLASALEGYPVTPKMLERFAKDGWRRQQELDRKVAWKSPDMVPQLFTTDPLDGNVVVLPRLAECYRTLRAKE